MGRKDYIVFDVMADGRFICTLKYPHCSLFKVDMDDMMAFAMKKRPTLKYERNIELWIC